jgi:hypothetical protein
MRPNLLSRMVLFAWMGCLAPTISAAFDEDEARGPASPPRAEAAPTIAASPGSAGERSIYIVTIGGAIAYVVVQLGTKGIELLAAGRKKWIEADAGTDHKRWEDCEAAKLVLQQAIDRKDGELRMAWTTIGEKDKQIGVLTEHVRSLLQANGELTKTIGQNNANLIERIPPAKPPAPLSVSIDPASGPISVHEVEPPKGGAA